MKVLTALVTLQTVVVLFLLIRMMDIDERVDQCVPSAVSTLIDQHSESLSDQRQSGETRSSLDENLLRKIVREELREQLNAPLEEASQSASSNISEPVSAAEYHYRLEAAMQSLDHFIEQGEISDLDMIKLQEQIGRLDEDGRRQMLSLLAQALSSGELEGRF